MANCPHCHEEHPDGMVVCPATSRLIARVDRPPDPLIGAVLEGKFRIEQKLGEGGMGAVYTGEQLAMKRRVAIKTLLPQFTSNVNAAERFRREALAASAMGHSNIITIHDLGQTPDGMLYIVMEYLDGRDLGKEMRELKKRGIMAMDPQRAFDVMTQVAEGLAAAHEKGVVHRDLKPDNIFLVPARDGTDRVKLLDFGISKIRTPSPEQKNLTTDGSLLGTPYYMSPEQAQGKSDIDHRADIYAYGVILYELLTGQVPFEDENMLRVIAMHALEEPRPPRSINPSIPPQVEGLILRAMAKQPGNRFQTMNDVLASLRAVASGGVANFSGMQSGGLPVGGFDVTGMGTPAPGVGSNPSWGATTPAPINTMGARVGSNVQSWTGQGTGPVAGTQTATPMAWSEGGPPKSGGGMKIAAILGGVGVLLVGAVIGVVALAMGGEEEATNPPPVTTTTTVPTYPTNPTYPTYPTNPVVPTYPTNPVVPTYPTNPVMPVNPIPTPALPMPTKVAIRIESTPETADVYEGSQRLGTTPYLLTADMGSAPRSFVLKRSGFRDRALTITPDRNDVVTAELERERRAPTTKVRNTTGHSSGTTKTSGHGLTKANPFD